MTDGETYPRDMVGYGRTPPYADWPNNARVALQFVINYEEGGENNILHGDAASEAFLSEIVGAAPWPGMRHMNMELIYEYGSRAGFWRLHRLFTERSVPVTVYAVATAMARNPEAVAAMNEAGWEIATHGLKWIDYRDMPPTSRRAISRRRSASIPRSRARGRSASIRAARRSTRSGSGMEEGGFRLLRRHLRRRSALLARRAARAATHRPLHARFQRHAICDAAGLQLPAISSTPISRIRSTRSTPRATSRRKCCRSACIAALSAGPGRAASLARFVDYVLEPRSSLDSDPARHRASLDPQTSAAGRLEAVAPHAHAVRRAVRRRLRALALGRGGGLRRGPDRRRRHRRGPGEGDGRRGGQGVDAAEARADRGPSRSRRQARARADADAEFDQRAGERRARPAHARGTARVRRAQRRLSRPLRLSLHHGGQGQEQGRNPRRLRAAASPTTPTPRPRPRSAKSTGSRRCGSRTSCLEREARGSFAAASCPSTTIPAVARSVGVLADRRRRRSRRRRTDRGGRRARDVLARAPRDAVVDDHAGCLIMPGFIDAHIHYPQTQVIGSYGAQLLDWLHNYTFVEEQKFADPAHCARVAEFFLDELFRSGTTTAMVYCTVHPQSVEAFFAAAETARRAHDRRQGDDGPRRAAGRSWTRPQRGYDESKALIERWRGRGRLDYAITPRFAVTSTRGATRGRGRARARVSGLLRPDPCRREQGRDRPRRGSCSRRRKSYLDVYARAGLLGPRSVFGHCIHLLDGEVAALGGEPIGRRVLPDLQSLSRLGPVRSRRGSPRRASGSRSRPTSAAARAIRCCTRRRRATRCCSSTGSRGRRCTPSTA